MIKVYAVAVALAFFAVTPTNAQQRVQPPVPQVGPASLNAGRTTVLAGNAHRGPGYPGVNFAVVTVGSDYLLFTAPGPNGDPFSGPGKLMKIGQDVVIDTQGSRMTLRQGNGGLELTALGWTNSRLEVVYKQ